MTGGYSCPVEDCTYCGSKSGRAAHLKFHDDDVVKEAYLDELRRLADTLGRTPTSNDMNDQGRFSERPYLDQFGSWNEALEAAGIEVSRHMFVSDEELIDSLQRLGSELGRTPYVGDMNERGDFSHREYSKRFGSWNEALTKAGFELNRQRNATDETLLNEIRRLNEKLDRVPLRNDLREHGKFSRFMYAERFEDWPDALEKAGFEPLSPHEYMPSGEDHHAWAGGMFTYGPGWNDTKKEQVRERDGRQCMNCGRSEDDHIELYGCKQHVHHIQKARSFDDPLKRNDPSNLVTLCMTKKCHQKWELMSPLRPQVGIQEVDN